MADRLHHVQSHRLVGQEPQGPTGVPCGRLPAPERDQSCLALAIQARVREGRCGFFRLRAASSPWFDQPLSDPQHSIDTDREALGDLGIRPSRPIRIGVQEDVRMADLERLQLCLSWSAPSTVRVLHR